MIELLGWLGFLACSCLLLFNDFEASFGSNGKRGIWGLISVGRDSQLQALKGQAAPDRVLFFPDTIVPGREDFTRNRFWLLGNSSRWGKKSFFYGYLPLEEQPGRFVQP